jgi:Ca2+-binding RTX toxin-like protein
MATRKWGSEELVNTNTANLQGFPQVAALANGGFVVVWIDTDEAGGDGDQASIKMQRYDAAGNKLGAETVANATAAGDQTVARVALLSNGDYVVAWGDTNAGNIEYRRFQADGTPVDLGDRVLNVAGDQFQPEISAIAGGGFVIAYADFQSGNADVHAQRFDANGDPTGGVITVASGAAAQSVPAIAQLTGGDFVTVWDEGSNIRFQRFDGSGSLLGGVNTVATTFSDPELPDVLALANGGFVVSWADNINSLLLFPDNASLMVRAKIYNASGTAVVADFTINSFAVNEQQRPKLVALPDGGFAAIYRSDGEIRGQVFDAFGARVGSEFLVNTTTSGTQDFPTVTGLADGRLVVAWNDDSATGGDTSNMAVRMQIIDPRDGSITGTANGEILLGHDAVADEINALGGNDTLNGMAGADFMYGGEGDDTYVADNAGDQAIELLGHGTDTVQSAVSFSLGDNAENLTLTGASAINGTGNALDNILTGNAAANVLNGMGGADQMTGGLGNDTYTVDNAGDVVTEASSTGGIDLVNSSITHVLGNNVENLMLTGTANISGTGNTLANVITGNSGNNTLSGGARNDTINGGSGNDVLNGDANNDTLNGGSGVDVLTGGTGRDIMTGGTSGDDFDFNAVNEGGKTAATRDIITDFVHGSDDIDLSTIDARSTMAGNQAFTFLAANGAAFTGAAGQLRWFQENPAGSATDKTIIEGDVNGDAKADFQIQLAGLKTLTASDFVL